MNIVINVDSVDKIADARTAAEAVMVAGDTLEVVVTPPKTGAGYQPARPAGGLPAGMKG